MPSKLRDPIFILDSEERFHPLAVESIEKVPTALIEADGNPRGDVRLDLLPPEGGRMNFPPDPDDAEQRLRREFGGVGYRREQEGAASPGSSTGSGTSTTRRRSTRRGSTRATGSSSRSATRGMSPSA